MNLSIPNPLVVTRNPYQVFRKQYRATFVAQSFFSNSVT